MLAKYILAAFGVGFLIAAASYVRAGRKWKIAARTWLLVGAIFAVVSAWLHFSVPGT